MSEQFHIRKYLRQILLDLRLAGVSHLPARFFAPSAGLSGGEAPAEKVPSLGGKSARSLHPPKYPASPAEAEGREELAAFTPSKLTAGRAKEAEPAPTGEKPGPTRLPVTTSGRSGQADREGPGPSTPELSLAFCSLTVPVWAQEEGQTRLSAEEKRQRLTELAQRVARCQRCPELVRNRTQTVFADGNPESPLVFVGEAPGAEEDKQGLPFVGRAGQLLTDIITKGMGLRREDVYICNVIKCRPPENRTPTPTEVANCREYLDEQLTLVRPRFICCLGSVAAQRILGSKQSMTKLRGQMFTVGPVKVVCTYHPAYLLRNPEAKRETWEDIKLLMREMGLSPPPAGRTRR